jgi:hypothetical protein
MDSYHILAVGACPQHNKNLPLYWDFSPSQLSPIQTMPLRQIKSIKYLTLTCPPPPLQGEMKGIQTADSVAKQKPPFISIW